MTEPGLLHLLSAIYLSGVICLAYSLNENRDLRRIVRETLRRWAKFIAITLAVATVVSIIS